MPGLLQKLGRSSAAPLFSFAMSFSTFAANLRGGGGGGGGEGVFPALAGGGALVNNEQGGQQLKLADVMQKKSNKNR